MNEFELKCELILAETCVDSLTIAALLVLTGQNDTDLAALLPMRMAMARSRGLTACAMRLPGFMRIRRGIMWL